MRMHCSIDPFIDQSRSNQQSRLVGLQDHVHGSIETFAPVKNGWDDSKTFCCSGGTRRDDHVVLLISWRLLGSWVNVSSSIRPSKIKYVLQHCNEIILPAACLSFQDSRRLSPAGQRAAPEVAVAVMVQ
jgi:hypothetical protein